MMRLLLILLVLASPRLLAAEPLPEPLTLDAALEQASRPNHYEILLAEAERQKSAAEAEAQRAENELTLDLEGRWRKVGLSDNSPLTDDDDSLAGLYLRKPLYDFGRSAAADALAEQKLRLSELQKQWRIRQRELKIVELYYQVLDADNEFLRHNEELAIGFIRYDRMRENRDLGLASDIDVEEKLAAYELIRQNRYRSENRQRLTRQLLAEALGYPDSPPDELAVPEIDTERSLPEVDVLMKQAMRSSPRIGISRQQVQIARQAIRQAEKEDRPQLDAELEVAKHFRDNSTRDNWRASIYFDVPLYRASSADARLRKARAAHRKALAELDRTRSELRVEILKLWQQLRQSRLRLQGALAAQEYRDLYLDRSRADYELEFKSDLGDAMVQFSDARWKVWRARFDFDLAWRKLETLVGADLETLAGDSAAKPDTAPPGDANG